MKKISFIALVLSLSVSSFAFSAERQKERIATPTTLKELMALPETTTSP